jgi:hypothetical protein
MVLLADLGSQSATYSDGAFMPAQFVTSALQEVSVCLCRCNTDLEQAVAKCFTRVSGNRGACMHGATRPTVELV